MKNTLKIIALSGLGFVMASCGALTDPYGNNDANNYPNNYPNSSRDGQVYRTQDGTVYRQGEIYRDGRGDVYQNGRIIRRGEQTGYPGILGRNGNNNVNYPTNSSRRMPPGQAKKIYGGNAKDYAPGQVKKRNGSWDNNNTTWRKDDDDDRNGKKYEDRKFNDKDDKNKKFKNKNGKRGNNDD